MAEPPVCSMVSVYATIDPVRSTTVRCVVERPSLSGADLAVARSSAQGA